MKHYTHIIRFGIIMLIIGIVFFTVRSYMVPESFGTYKTYTYGYHRGDSDKELQTRYSLYQDSAKCKKCHEEQYLLKDNSTHSSLACETCHGNWQAHNNNTEDKTGKNISPEACLLCHQKLLARPASFPQITGIEQCLKKKPLEVKDDIVCIDCHNPHNPVIDEYLADKNIEQ